MPISTEDEFRLVAYVLPDPGASVDANDRSHIAYIMFGLIASADGAVHYITKSLKHLFTTLSLDHNRLTEARKHHFITEDAEDV